MTIYSLNGQSMKYVDESNKLLGDSGAPLVTVPIINAEINKECYSAILRFIKRLYELSLNKNNEKSLRIQKALHTLTKGAPENIFEAMLTIYLYFMISESVDCFQVRSLGNGLDNTLLPFYEKDIQSGTFSRDEIKEFTAYFLIQWSAIGNYWGQPFYLGGSDEKGKTKINDLSYDIIDVYSRLGIYNPKIQIKL